jgi:hypothetical protein
MGGTRYAFGGTLTQSVVFVFDLAPATGLQPH